MGGGEPAWTQQCREAGACLLSLDAGASGRLRLGISYGNVCDLPLFSQGPHGDAAELHRAVSEAGYEGLQDGDPELCARFGLTLLGSGLLRSPKDADALAAFWKARGASRVTCLAGFGMESDDEMNRYAAAIVEASDRHELSLLLETHRASITQDAWRTVQLAKHFPALHFILDFSHWFTGQEMAYGDFEARLSFLEPVLARTRFLHGRVGDRCCMQVPIAVARQNSLSAFCQVWTQVMRGFLTSPGSEEKELWFCPELLGTTYSYARQFRSETGEFREETDRWQEAQALVAIARDCFNQASVDEGRLSLLQQAAVSVPSTYNEGQTS